MRTEIAALNHCAVPILSRVDVNLYWYCSTILIILQMEIKLDKHVADSNVSYYH